MSVDLRELSQLTADQWGLITSRQAAGLGISRVKLSRMASRGVLERLAHGVYRTSSTPDDQTTMVRAIWLSQDPGRTALERIAVPHEAGVVSHESAASLHQMGDLQEYQHHLTFPGRKQTRRGDVVLHQESLKRDDVVLVDGLPCTSPERTIADLWGARHELEHLAQALIDGVDQGKIDFQLLLDALERTQRRTGPAGVLAAQKQFDELRRAAGVDAEAIVERAAGSALGGSIAAKWLETAGFQGLLSLPDLSALKMPPVIDAALVQQMRGLSAISAIKMPPVMDPTLMQQLVGLGSQAKRITNQVGPLKALVDQHPAARPEGNASESSNSDQGEAHQNETA